VFGGAATAIQVFLLDIHKGSGIRFLRMDLRNDAHRSKTKPKIMNSQSAILSGISNDFSKGTN
jgi:hypothetical protein